jgi:hypothetical protein
LIDYTQLQQDQVDLKLPHISISSSLIILSHQPRLRKLLADYTAYPQIHAVSFL